jgi:molybdate transport system substrate-binding protein
VYGSDAMVSDKVEIAGVFPAHSHSPIVYPIALVAGANSMDKKYFEYLQSSASMAIFAKYGFSVTQ